MIYRKCQHNKSFFKRRRKRRVNFISQTNYSAGKRLEKLIFALIDKIKAESAIFAFKEPSDGERTAECLFFHNDKNNAGTKVHAGTKVPASFLPSDWPRPHFDNAIHPMLMLMYGKVSQENYVELTAASAIPNKEIKSPQILRY